MLNLDQNGEFFSNKKKVTGFDMQDLLIEATKRQKFLYTWSRKNDLVLGGIETFVVLSLDPPAFEPSLQYSVLHDPAA